MQIFPGPKSRIRQEPSVFGQNTHMLLRLIPEKNIEDQLRVTSLWPVATKPSLEAETEISLNQKHQI